MILALLAGPALEGRSAAPPVALGVGLPDGVSQAPAEPDQSFLQSAMDFLARENVDPRTVDLELKPLGAAGGTWREVAKVTVDPVPEGGYRRRLIFDPAYWLETERKEDPAVTRRWTKFMWHEVHHLKYFPENLRRARLLAAAHKPKRRMAAGAWEHQWVELLEPLEELAAERDALTRYEASFGAVPEDILTDSRGDMRKHAARYQELLAGILKKVRRPAQVRREFPLVLPVDAAGNILPN